jgi:uroporphyrinogen decarboxylase
MISGSGRDGFADALNALRSGTDVPARLLDLLTGCVADYLSAQIEAGADAVQIFDTWGGLLTPDEYRRTSLPAIAAVIERLPRKGVPVIVFSKGAGASVREIAAAGPDVVGLGPDDDIGEMRRLVGETVALQGNLDPDSLSLPADELLARAGEILSGFGKGPGHVFNLGHGIRPDAPVDNVKALVRFVKSESAQYHQ